MNIRESGYKYIYKKWVTKNGSYNSEEKSIDWTITINEGSPLNINVLL